MDINYSNTSWGLGGMFGSYNNVRDEMFRKRNELYDELRCGGFVEPRVGSWLPPSGCGLYNAEVKPVVESFVEL